MTARTPFLCALACAALCLAATPLVAQDTPDSTKKEKYTSSKFWESTEPFELTLSVNIKQLQADKGDPGPWRAATVAYTDGAPRAHAARVRTRGRSRLKICDRFPPIWVDFQKEDVKGTQLRRLNRFKLVAPCKYPPDYERYVVGEYNVYRIHQLFTPISHRARLVKLTVKDSASGKEAFTKYAFAVEDIDEVAQRVGGVKMAVEGLTNTDLEPRQLAVMGLLQYMIGNTDFSFSARHNLEFVVREGKIYPIIFDYDQAGVINTVYSLPDASLGIRKVTERVYRGLCVSPDTIHAVLADMKAKRPAIEALYKDELGKLMGGMMASTAVRYIGGFYSEVENPKNVQRNIIDRCAIAR
ncbi:MAG TPA: hypothetical protein VFO55_01695 [Gemmatimonadaceae bacterium]|nr:hypothetical protein [Gemmatimonadaceae bacterium]